MTTAPRGLFVDDPSKLNEITMTISKSDLDTWKSVDKDYFHFLDAQPHDTEDRLVKITFEYNPNFLSNLLRSVFHTGVMSGISIAFKSVNNKPI